MHRLNLFGFTAVICAAMLGAPPAVLAEADGPDAWRVSGVAADDVLNIRMGPGAEYPIIGTFPPDARHLRAETCTPLFPPGNFIALSASERAALPDRWCLVNGGAEGRGWVAQAFLVEDTVQPWASRQASSDGAAVPPPFDIAVPLVRNLFEKEAFLLSRGETVLVDADLSRAWFSLDLARRMSQEPRAFSIFDGQDIDLSEIRVTLGPAQPIVRGTVTVLVEFTNFGVTREARAHVRADPEQGGAFRIFSIEHQSDDLVQPPR